MDSNKDINPIVSAMITWYEEHKRSLPWRETTDPYRIWLSEIILQQTRVAQGYDYYQRFVTHFPTLKALASASQDEVFRLWQGLGYYTRARNLHRAAGQIAERHGGVFPSTYKEIRALSGIGPYTAAAISSFAYQLPYAVVDGNVYRVLSRLFDIGTPIDTSAGSKLFAQLSQELLDTRQPATYNQAIMEFGALQCTPASPQCPACPIQTHCLSYARHTTALRPVKQGKTQVSTRYFTYLHITYGNRLWLRKRIEKDIWQHLYELPLIETAEPIELTTLQHMEAFTRLFGKESISIHSTPYRAEHLLSHRRIQANCYHITLSTPLPPPDTYIEIEDEEREKYAVSRLTQRYFEHFEKKRKLELENPK